MSTPDTEPPGQGLNTDQAKYILAEMLGRNLDSENNEDDKKLVQLRAASKSKVLAVLEDEIMDTNGKTIEKQNAQITYARAKDLLASVGFDLEKSKAQAVQLHEKWGLIKALRKKKIVKNAAEYATLFDNVQFTQKGIYQLMLRLEAGEDWIPIFNPGNMLPSELWDVLIRGGKIPFDYDDSHSYGCQNLSEMRKINPKNIPDLANLISKSRNQQVQAFQEAYQQAPELQPDFPSILFTPNQLEVTNINKSAIQHAQTALVGAEFMDFRSDLIRWRMQKKQTGKYPDSRNWTQYPLYLFKEDNVAANAQGRDEGLDVAALRWYPGDRVLALDYSYPSTAADNLGPRAALR